MAPSRLPPSARCAALCLLTWACSDDDAAEVASVAAEPTTLSQARLSVELSAPGAVAAACVRRDDPAEVHLVEGAGDTSVELRVGGLLAGADYDCNVAGTSGRGKAATTSFRTPDAPSDLPTADVIANPAYDPIGPYTVMNVRPECTGDGDTNYLTVLDPDGGNRWWHALPKGMNIGVEVLPDGKDRFLWGGGKDPVGAPTVVDVFDGEVWRLEFPGSAEAEFHHDANRIDDGRILSVEDTYEPGWAAFRLRLSDESGETTWLWDVQDAVADGWLDADGSDDPHHLNWADVVQTDQGLVAYGSLCFDYKIVAIDVESSEPLWRFGYGGDFTLVDAQGDPLPDQDDFPECQHGLQTDGTHLFMYDNGMSRGYTRAVEYELDLENMTATKTWEWLDEGYWELYHGGVEWLTPDHERVLVAEPANDCDADARHAQVIELDRSTDTEVHRLILRDVGDWIYRAHRVDGCELFANTKYCPALADRLDQLRSALDL